MVNKVKLLLFWLRWLSVRTYWDLLPSLKSTWSPTISYYEGVLNKSAVCSLKKLCKHSPSLIPYGLTTQLFLSGTVTTIEKEEESLVLEYVWPSQLCVN